MNHVHPLIVLINCPYMTEIYCWKAVTIYTVDPIHHGAWGPGSASMIYPDRDISRGGSLPRRCKLIYTK